jgi:hypothetical protein
MLRSPYWPSLGLIVLTFAAFLPVLQFGFINFDDHEYVLENKLVNEGLSWAGLVGAFTNFVGGNYHPLTVLSHQLDCTLFGLHPQAMHGVNLALHAANAVLVFLLFQRLLDRDSLSLSPSPGEREKNESAVQHRHVSWSIAALFAVHPLHVESVAWISERKDVLCVLLGLLTLRTYVQYTAQPSPFRYLSILCLFVLSLLAKPMMVTLPCVLLLLDYWPLRRLNRNRWLFAVLEKLPLLVPVLVSSIMTMRAQSGESVLTLSELSLRSRLVVSVNGYLWYLQKTFWPTNLAIVYAHPGDVFTWTQALVPVLVLAMISGVAIWQLGPRPWLFVGWAWFAGTLVPVIGLVQVGNQMMADRYTYFPHLGLFLSMGILALEGVRRWHVPWVWPVLGLSIAIAGCTILTWHQVQVWRDSRTLWQHALAVTERNYFALNWVARHKFLNGDHEEAIDLADQAVRIKPNFGLSWQTRGHLKLELARRRSDPIMLDAALADLRESYRLDPMPQTDELLQQHDPTWARERQRRTR